jgi:hypothetical protein
MHYSAVATGIFLVLKNTVEQSHCKICSLNVFQILPEKKEMLTSPAPGNIQFLTLCAPQIVERCSMYTFTYIVNNTQICT